MLTKEEKITRAAEVVAALEERYPSSSAHLNTAATHGGCS